MQRFIIEMGMGISQQGRDYTKAATRAIEDAIRHSSLSLFETLDLPKDAMELRVSVAVQAPHEVDKTKLIMALPRGKAVVQVIQGGLDVTNPDTDAVTVIASAAVEAFLPAEMAQAAAAKV